MSESAREPRPRRTTPRAGPPARDASPADPIELDYRGPTTGTAVLAKDVTARNLDGLATIACIYLALITIAFAAFRFLNGVQPPGASRNPDRTFFAAVNAVTMTGFTTNAAAPASYPAGGQALMALLATGGALTLLIGGGAFLRSTFGMRSAMGWGKLIAMSLGVVAWPLLLSPIIGAFDAISAATGFGWATSPDALAGDPPGLRRWLMLAASVPAAAGPLLLYWLFVKGVPARCALISRTWLALAAVYLLATLAFVAAGVSMPVASFEALNLRGLGLAGDAPGTLPNAMVWLMLPVMCLGGGPASIAGGVGLLPIVLVARGISAMLKGQRVEPIVGVALAWIGAFIGLLVLLVVLFAATTQPMPGDRQLFLIVSAFCNVGISHDPIGITGSGLVVISAAMIAGRALSLVMLCWMAIVAEQDEATQAH